MWRQNESQLIWSYENFFSDQTLDLLLGLIKNHFQRSIVKSNLDNPLFSPSKFHYRLIHSSVRTHEKIVFDLKERLNSLWQQLNEPQFPPGPLKTSQMMLKFFDKNSKYDLHTEDPNIFGSWAYVIYLTDELDGKIFFPAAHSYIFKQKTKEITDWNIMKGKLLERNHPILYPKKDVSILPKKNLAIVFRSGLPHKVFPIYKHFPGRFTLTGWPFSQIP